MRTVLGIDAAWTVTEPSGVALATEKSDGWHLVAASSSYQDFLARAELPLPEVPDFQQLGPLLVKAVVTLCGRGPDLVAIDMPLSRTPIVGRRVSDNCVSNVYGARHCGTHSPSAARPGRISDSLRHSFAEAGYPLLTTEIVPPGVIEVYPHPALVELTGSDMRLPYKVGKTSRYWPGCELAWRRAALRGQWLAIVEHLECQVAGVATKLPPLDETARGAALKAYEDGLDAVVCAWVAVVALDGLARPYGDADSSIWIPTTAARRAVANEAKAPPGGPGGLAVTHLGPLPTAAVGGTDARAPYRAIYPAGPTTGERDE